MRIVTKDQKVIVLEQFDRSLWNGEKEFFDLWYDRDPSVYHVGCGNRDNDWDDKTVGSSALWSRRPIQEFRVILWEEIKKYLHRWDEICRSIDPRTGSPRRKPRRCEYLNWTMAIVESLRRYGYVRLVHMNESDREKSEMICRYVAYVHEHYVKS